MDGWGEDACPGGECFGAGRRRFRCAEPDDRLRQAVAFLPEAFSRTQRVEASLNANPLYRLGKSM